MKSPAELAQRLARQWQKTDLREARLLDEEGAWPLVLAIPRPSAQTVQHDTRAVKAHLDQWRKVKVGEVIWKPISYRATSESIEVPTHWQIDNPKQWIAATKDETIHQELAVLQIFLAETDPLFHSLLIRRRSLWKSTPVREVIQATRLALGLEPGCAKGRPLRAISQEGIDTKFFERNERLIVSLLDCLHDGEASRAGLNEFLGAYHEGDHWLLVLDLDGSLLPFARQRLSSLDLATAELPGSHLIIIENEACQHQLPSLSGTLAILGTGFDLAWTTNPSLRQKALAYWGDLDTWGLELLGKARQNLPHLTPLLMDASTFQAHHQKAVPEPVAASTQPHPSLLAHEQSLYAKLLAMDRGRLEQEFIVSSQVQTALQSWRKNSRSDGAP